jgi:D-xylose 1-dehydrogenase (NADP+, D-xylono-1,5-lactone-forming)
MAGSTSERVRWGLLSTARINDKLLAGASGSERVEVLGVASRREETAAAYARERGIARSYGSYDAMLADDDIEAVYISLPNAPHVQWSIRALQAGKHVLCEKPLSARAAEVQRAFDVADASGRLLMEAFMYRHNPQMTRLIELIGEGAIGRPRIVRSSFSFAIDDVADPRLSVAMGGGALMDVGCYCVNAARMLCGEPQRVHGEQLLGGDGVDVAFAGVMRFAGDVVAHFDSGVVLERSETLIVLGEEGRLELPDPWHCRAAGIERHRGDRVESIAVDTVNSYTLELDNLSAAIRGTGTPLLGRDDALGQAATIEALYRSAGEHRAVAL